MNNLEIVGSIFVIFILDFLHLIVNILFKVKSQLIAFHDPNASLMLFFLIFLISIVLFLLIDMLFKDLVGFSLN